MLANIGLAFVDSQCWHVTLHEVLEKLCTKEEIKVQHLILEHKQTAEPLRLFNSHMPSSYAT